MRRVRLITLPVLLPTRAYMQVLLPGIVFVKRGYTPNIPDLAHELVHIHQIERYGLLRYWWRYIRLSIRHDWYSHPIEQEAVSGEADQYWRSQAAIVLRQHSLI